ncbi:LVIVD repeat-containing protein [Paraburkholderia sp.]|uniref:LVIVD repeat-containing protein n=1 Tax=Paraburkholderia sp. TaxID=1926495 RepID=UPI003D6E0EEE
MISFLQKSSVTIGVALVLTACGGGNNNTPTEPSAASIAAYVVPRATCGVGDKPETALQGQVPASMRNSFAGNSCNLQLVGQLQGEGASWSSATYTDSSGHTCAYHATMSNTDSNGVSRGRINPGVPVIDITDPTKPVRVRSLTSTAMMDPWESLRVNVARGLLVADNGANGGGGPELDVYDISSNCLNPQLLASANISDGLNGGVIPSVPVIGHEGGISPDGLTYYIGSLASNAYYAVDITVPSKPKLIASLSISGLPLGGVTHGVSISTDGNNAYLASIGASQVLNTVPAPLADPNAKVQNGFYIADTSEVQARKPGAAIKIVSSVPVRDGSVSQTTIPVIIKGKHYVIYTDEGGAGGIPDPATATEKAACAANLAPFPMAHIFDISDSANPKQVSELRLETHVAANCDKVLPDVTGLSFFTYGSHYCSVDNRENATALACSYFNSGIRVFDIRNPAAPKEIAYFNPAGTQTNATGSPHFDFAQWHPGSPDWCSSRIDFDFDKHRLTTACQDNGLLVMNFENNVWPMSDSVKAADEGN